jgi:hypothetical protein
MKFLLTASFILAIGTAILNQFNPFSLLLLTVTGIGVLVQKNQ